MTTEPMPKPDTGVYRRDRSMSWQWRIKAPKELRHLYRTDWAHRCSLQTADLREANRKAAALRSEWLGRFDAQRRELHAQPADKITPELGKLLAERVAHHLLATDERLRSDPAELQALLAPVAGTIAARSAIFLGPAPPPVKLPEAFTAELDALDGLPPDLARMWADLNAAADGEAAVRLAARRAAEVLPLAQAEARKLGITFDRTTPGAVEALRECLSAYRKARAAIVERDHGAIVETPKAPTEQTVKAARPMRLRDVFGRWKAAKVRGADALRACERALKLYEQHTGDPPVQELTRMQGDSFRAYLLTLGSSSKTAHDRITWVKSLLGYACRDLELIPRQPWEGIDIAHRTENPRKRWSPDELAAFFGLPLFTRYELPRNRWKAGGDAAYWVPLLGLFTGARVGELCQLRVADVVADADGLPALRITDEAEGATVKSEAGNREVPIHPELIRLGFMDYVDATRKAGAVQLWPLLKFRDGKPSGYFSAWFGDARKLAPIPVPDFHSLRHTVRSKLTDADVPEPLQDRITGHEVRGSVGTKVYDHVSASKLRQAVERISFPGLTLPRVYGQTDTAGAAPA